jgi:hypothetical protein
MEHWNYSGLPPVERYDAAVDTVNDLLSVLKAITEIGDDCPACDRGVLRHPAGAMTEPLSTARLIQRLRNFYEAYADQQLNENIEVEWVELEKTVERLTAQLAAVQQEREWWEKRTDWYVAERVAQTEELAALRAKQVRLREVARHIVRETDGNPSMILFDGQPYKPVPERLCDALAAVLDVPQTEEQP